MESLLFAKKNPQSRFLRASHENMTKIVHWIQLSHIPSSSINFSIVTITAPLFRKEVIGWKEAIASRRLGTKKVDVLKKLSTTAELEKYSSNDYISYKNFEGLFRYCFLCTLDFPLTKSIDNIWAQQRAFHWKVFCLFIPYISFDFGNLEKDNPSYHEIQRYT